ncbi:hypothetical protein Vadar_023461 [Vaccinium darrowii]|uniref:Uncharacterized protein n=1 Tax=Vaccinium darrowii TaxID=229202 RepID=A0ACB7ZM46_9ERIC|nr:hypothetical protein Vadar_023461 [Vaccinium darrowii]
MSPEEFLDWVNAVEEIMDFKEVPMERRVPLMATRFRGRASAWWQQLKISRNRQGKTKITNWEKLKKKMRVEFLPHNYTRIMYQRLQNFRQNTRSVDDYTDEFYQLVARNDLSETQEQLILRYVGGLRAQFQDELIMYDLCSVSDAHQRALVLEKRFARRPVGNWSSTARASAGAAPPTRAVRSQPAVPAAIKPVASASPYKCFKCGEPGHRMADCRKGDRPGKALFIEPDGAIHDSPEGYDQEPLFDDGSEEMEEIVVEGDTGPLLVVRRIKLLPSRGSAPVGPSLLTRAQMEEEIAESGIAYVLVGEDDADRVASTWMDRLRPRRPKKS